MSRLSWDDYFMKIVSDVCERSTCNRGKPGCVIVKNNRILATGYAGSPPGFPHCDDVGHEMEERLRFIETEYKADNPNFHTFNADKKRFESAPSQHCIRTIHAEQNAIYQAARSGVAIEGATLYVNMTPCRNCAMALIAVGIVRVVAGVYYPSSWESIRIFNQANVPLIHLDDQALFKTPK